MISRTGACSSPGLVVGEAGSGTGVCDDAAPLDDAGDDWASCESSMGGREGIATLDPFLGEAVALLARGASARGPSSGKPPSPDTVVGGRGWESEMIGADSTRPFAIGASSDGLVEEDREVGRVRGDSGRLTGCTGSLLAG